MIVDAKNTKSNNVVTPFDDIMLKSPFSAYLIVVSGAPDFLVGTGGGGIEISEQQVFRIAKANIPFLPDWLFKRPHLNHSQSQLLTKAGAGTMSRQRLEEKTTIPLGKHPVEIQELFLIEDLLFAMNGIEGSYIKRRQVQSALDGSIIKTEF